MVPLGTEVLQECRDVQEIPVYLVILDPLERGVILVSQER